MTELPENPVYQAFLWYPQQGYQGPNRGVATESCYPSWYPKNVLVERLVPRWYPFGTPTWGTWYPCAYRGEASRRGTCTEELTGRLVEKRKALSAVRWV